MSNIESPTILLTFRVKEADVQTRGIREVLSDIRLEDGGKIIVPVHARGLIINNPAPAGTWVREA